MEKIKNYQERWALLSAKEFGNSEVRLRDEEIAELRAALGTANQRIEDLTTAANRCINDALGMAQQGDGELPLLPWGNDIEAWLEVRSSSEIHRELQTYIRLSIAQRAGSGEAKSEESFHHYGMSTEQLQQLLSGALKPEEISGADDVQHDRVSELVWWFARLTQGNANSKWAIRHACELAYFIAANGINRHIDLKAIRDAAFKEGVNITPEERGTLERIGFATSRLLSQPDSERDAALLDFIDSRKLHIMTGYAGLSNDPIYEISILHGDVLDDSLQCIGSGATLREAIIAATAAHQSEKGGA